MADKGKKDKSNKEVKKKPLMSPKEKKKAKAAAKAGAPKTS